MKEKERKEPETTPEGERKRVCRYGLEMERCSRCLFENLCHLEETNSLVNKMK